MFNLDRHRIKNCEIRARDISDHAGVYLTLHLDNKPNLTLWRLNTSLLSDPQCQKLKEGEFKDYMSHNNNGAVSQSTLWDAAAKAVMRGKLIMWSAWKKKEGPDRKIFGE